MPHIIVIYGPHGNNDFLRLQPILHREITNLHQSANNILSIIEYNGPYQEQFQEFKSNFPGENPESLFNIISSGQARALQQLATSGNPIYHTTYRKRPISFGFNIINNRFYIDFINFLRGRSVGINLQIPHYRDWRKINRFLVDDNQPSNFLEVFLFKTLLCATEKTFINQLIEETDNNPTSSFIIVRGDFHKKYYKNIRKQFDNMYEISKFEYDNY